MTDTRVFVVDDHAVLRQGLRLLIDAQHGMTVVGEADRGYGVEDLVVATRADVVVLDISMPQGSGVDAAAAIRRKLPNVKIVALTRYAENVYVQQMMQAGANAYVLKQTAADVLVTAIRSVAAGGTFLDPEIAHKVAAHRSPHSHTRRGADLLTSREHEVLTMVAYGHTNKEIASTLGITVKTVEAHKTNLMQKLEITNRAELVRFALAQGLLGT